MSAFVTNPIQIKRLPEGTGPQSTDFIAGVDNSNGDKNAKFAWPVIVDEVIKDGQASQAEAELGVASDKLMTPELTKKAIAEIAVSSRKFESEEFAIPTSNTKNEFDHGFGVVPQKVVLVARCKTADNGYSVGDEIFMGPQGHSGIAVVTFGANNTKVFYVGNGGHLASNKNATGFFTPTNTNWNFVIRAFK